MTGDIPLHPLLVHFPIGLFIVGAIAQIVAIWQPKFFSMMAFVSILVGEIMGIAAYLTGDGAEEFAEEQWGENIHSLVETHQTFATITLIIFGVYLALRLLAFFIKVPLFRWMALILVLAGSVFITLTGHYGGKMVYQVPKIAQQQSHTADHDND